MARSFLNQVKVIPSEHILGEIFYNRTTGISCLNQLIKNHICIIEVKLIVFQKFSILKILMMLYHENFFGVPASPNCVIVFVLNGRN